MHVKHDDAFTIFHSQKSLSELFIELNKEANPPLYFAFLHFWIKLFGIGPVAVKSLSAIFSTGAAVVIFQIGKKHMNLLGALTASFLFLFSNVHFDFSHEVRAFSMVFFLAALSVYFFLNVLDKFRWKDAILLCIVNALLPYSHYTSVLLPFTEALILLFLIPHRFRDVLRTGASFVVSAILFVPQLLNFKETIPDENFWLDKPNAETLRFTLLKLSGHDPSYRNIKYVLLCGAVLTLLHFFFRVFSKRFDYKKFLLLVAVFFVPIYLNYWIAQYAPVFRMRYMLFAGVGITLALGYLIGLIRLPSIVKISLGFLLVLPFIKDFNPVNRRFMRWDHAAEIIRGKKKVDMACYILPEWRKNDFSYYYNRNYFKSYTTRDSLLNTEGIYPIYSHFDISNSHNGKSVILIIGDFKDKENEIAKKLNSQGFRLSEKWFESADIVIEHWALEQNN